MNLPDDDELYDVDQTYLGPPGRYIARIRYRALMIGPLLFLLGMATLAQTGLGYSVLTVGLLVIVSVRLTNEIVDRTSAERPLPVLFKIFGHELSARRPQLKGLRARAPRSIKAETTHDVDQAPTKHQARRRWHHLTQDAAEATNQGTR
jgi:hypothetical protein